jgi:hypothetical protein
MTAISPVDWRRQIDPRPVSGTAVSSIPAASYSRTQVIVPVGGQTIPLLSALQHLKDAVPFDLFRYASGRSDDQKDREDAERDYPGRYVALPAETAPVLAHLHVIMEQLPAGWQATVLPHGVIFYKEDYPYDYALDGWRRTEIGVEALPRGSRMTGSM